jgi:hypothetical protein
MFNRCLTLALIGFLYGCGTDEPTIHPTPLVMNVRIDVPNANPAYIEKYITKPISATLKSAPHVSKTHAIARTNGATIVVFFEDGIKFAQGETIIMERIDALSLPKQYTGLDFTELCGDDLSESNLMHLAQAKGIKPEAILDNVITVSEEMAESMLPAEELNAMFSNECDEPATNAPLYVLED